MPNTSSGRFRRQLNYGLLALAFVLILATSAVSVTSTNELGDSIGQVSHTHQTLELLTRMKVATGDAQANALRYLITGNTENQLLQREALAEMYALKVRLSNTVSDNPLQRSYMADFDELYKAFLSRSMESMAYKQKALKSGNETAFVKRIREGVGFNIIKDMRHVLDKMTEEENRLMVLRVAERDTLVKQTNATALIANALALVAGGIGFAAIRRSQEESRELLIVQLRAEQARQASEEKSSFLSNMSHEIRTPMNAIFGFTQLLSESVTAPLERDWVRSIKKSGQMLLALINDVLDISKIEAGKLQLNLQPTDIHELVGEIVNMFAPESRQKGIFLKHEIECAEREPMLIDGQRLRQILMNLLSNAIKYTEKGGVVVRLVLSPQHDLDLRHLRLFISDSGVGIDPNQLEKIFDPFHQANSPDGKIRQGTGLGLSICRRLVNAMQGELKVSSELGNGSTFMVEIPNVRVAESWPDSEAANENRIEFNRLRPLKILVVDDVAWNTEIAQGYLRNSHHEVHIADNGLDAVAMAKKLRPDVVLMDLRMQGMNGFEASDAIRSDPELQDIRIEIVVITASSLDSEETALRESFDGYVRKPYTPMDLFIALDSLFGKSKSSSNNSGDMPTQWSASKQLQWQQLRGEDLPDLQKSMRMREIGDYAKRLLNFSAETGFSSLEQHANLLSAAVQRFDVVAVNDALALIGSMPESFDNV
ncbi:MAG: ATP-binding protein [Arenimonas sp.]